jgi:hypothetical protein
MAAGHVIVVVVVALAIGLLLNAQDILATAERQEAGWQRTVGVAIMTPIAKATDVLFIDTPRNAVDAALGRNDAPVETTTTTAATSTTTAPTATTVPAIREVSETDPLRLFIGGDSMVGQFGPMLEARAEDSAPVEAEVIYEFESGITRPDFIDWPALLRDVRTEQDPDVMVLFFGGNDAQDIRIDGLWEPFGTDAWQEEYRTRVGALMQELDADGREVYWIGMPIVSSDTLWERLQIMNGIYESEADRFERVHYISSVETFSGPDGQYSEYLPDLDGDVVDMRLNDGIHLTTDGGILLAAHVWGIIADDWDLAG